MTERVLSSAPVGWPDFRISERCYAGREGATRKGETATGGIAANAASLTAGHVGLRIRQAARSDDAHHAQGARPAAASALTVYASSRRYGEWPSGEERAASLS